MLRIGLTCLLVLMASSAVCAAAIAPVADTFVRDGATDANTNFGASKILYVKNSSAAGYNRISYFKFSLSGLTGKVSSAKLRVYAALTGADSLVMTAYGVTDTSWSET